MTVSKNNSKGFTFIEMLVALAMLAITLPAIAVAVNGAFHTYEDSTTASEGQVLSNTLMQVVCDEVRWAKKIDYSNLAGGVQDAELRYDSYSHGASVTMKADSSGYLVVNDEFEVDPYELLDKKAYTSGLKADVLFREISHENESENDVIEITIIVFDSENNQLCTDTKTVQLIKGWDWKNTSSTILVNFVDIGEFLHGAIAYVAALNNDEYKGGKYSIDSTAPTSSSLKQTRMQQYFESIGVDLSGHYNVNGWGIRGYTDNFKYDHLIIDWTDVTIAERNVGDFCRFMRRDDSTSNRKFFVGYITIAQKIYSGSTYKVLGYYEYSGDYNSRPSYGTGEWEYTIECETLADAYSIYMDMVPVVTDKNVAADWKANNT